MYVNFSDDIYWTNIFKQYYANRKVEDIKLNLNSLKNYLNYAGSVEGMQKLEQDF